VAAEAIPYPSPAEAAEGAASVEPDGHETHETHDDAHAGHQVDGDGDVDDDHGDGGH